MDPWQYNDRSEGRVGRLVRLSHRPQFSVCSDEGRAGRLVRLLHPWQFSVCSDEGRDGRIFVMVLPVIVSM